MTLLIVSMPVISPKLAAMAAGFLASLNERQWGRALMRFDSGERHDWHYVPRQRPGLALREMDETRRAAAMALLHAGLGEAGMRKALAIMDRETIPKQAEPSETYDPLDYAFALHSDPRWPPRWAWSVEGHHFSLHFTLVSEREMTVTPSPAAAPGPCRGQTHPPA